MGWRPECSQALEVNVSRALPPDEVAIRVKVDVCYPPDECYQVEGGVRRMLTQVWVAAGVVCADEICATVVVVRTGYRPRFCSGYVHGVSVGEAGAV